MSRYIDAEKIPWTDLNDGRGGVNVYVTFLEKVARMPAADVQEVRHGHWKGINRNKYGDDEATCSLCGVTFSSGYSDPSWWDYCPSCGAKMDEVEDNG